MALVANAPHFLMAPAPAGDEALSGQIKKRGNRLKREARPDVKHESNKVKRLRFACVWRCLMLLGDNGVLLAASYGFLKYVGGTCPTGGATLNPGTQPQSSNVPDPNPRAPQPAPPSGHFARLPTDGKLLRNRSHKDNNCKHGKANQRNQQNQ